LFSSILALFLFFFQAEDGIRDFHVTGVQTCALPISRETARKSRCTDDSGGMRNSATSRSSKPTRATSMPVRRPASWIALIAPIEIGRASCREGVEITVGAGVYKK